MILLKIGSQQRPADRADEEWINQQIERRRADGQAVCVTVTVNQDGLNMALSTPGCGAGGAGRPPQAKEKEIFDLWGQVGLNDPQFTGSNVVTFLKRLSSLV
jgi:hypothetical protein